jgi:aminocarboxymuconate-semialdehyde decarboxylase
MRIVDVHSHLYPEPYLKLLERVVRNDSSGWAKGVQMLISNQFRSHPGMQNIEAHVEDMDRNGVEVHALSLSTPMAYLPDEKDAVEAARIFNDSLADICSRYPTRFKAFASLPLPHTDASLKELERAIDTLGLHGIGLGANAQAAGAQLDDPRILPVYPEINRRGLAVFLHPAIPPAVEEMLDYNMYVMSGFLWDGAQATLRLVHAGVFAQNPDMSFIVPHMGAMLLATIDRSAGPRRPIGESGKTAKEYCQDLYYDSITSNPKMWDLAASTVGVEHIVYGTDYPFGGGDGMARQIAQINNAPITDAQKEMIFGGTADRLLR